MSDEDIIILIGVGLAVVLGVFGCIFVVIIFFIFRTFRQFEEALERWVEERGYTTQLPPYQVQSDTSVPNGIVGVSQGIGFQIEIFTVKEYRKGWHDRPYACCRARPVVPRPPVYILRRYPHPEEGFRRADMAWIYHINEHQTVAPFDKDFTVRSEKAEHVRQWLTPETISQLLKIPGLSSVSLSEGEVSVAFRALQMTPGSLDQMISAVTMLCSQPPPP